MDTVKTLEEAQNWFLSHSSGAVRVVKDGEAKVCNNYLEAEEFLTQD